jgi:hypothetical protein
MTKHEYGGDINLSFLVSAEHPLTHEQLLQKIAEQIHDVGVADGQLSEVDHYMDGVLTDISGVSVTNVDNVLFHRTISREVADLERDIEL